MQNQDSNRLYLSHVIGALSYAFDLTEGQRAGHCLRSCWIGMRVGEALGMSGPTLSDLYYTLLLKDSGGSSNAGRLYGAPEPVPTPGLQVRVTRDAKALAKLAPKTSRARTELKDRLRCFSGQGRHGIGRVSQLAVERSARGAAIALQLGFNQRVADGVYCIGTAGPERDHRDPNRETESPLSSKIAVLFSRIARLAETVDRLQIKLGPQATAREVRAQSGSQLDPGVVSAFEQVQSMEGFWTGLESDGLDARVHGIEPRKEQVELTQERLDSIAVAFARIIDARSEFTAGHSERVAKSATSIGRQLGFAGSRLKWIWRGALLHDIGKLGISQSIWDKPGKLNEAEWKQVRRHPTFTDEILSRINPFRNMATIAANHHEKLDGSGYPKSLTAENIALESRIIAVADIYDALIAKRPYREGMSQTKALATMTDMLDQGAIDRTCFKALLRSLADERKLTGAA